MSTSLMFIFISIECLSERSVQTMLQSAGESLFGPGVGRRLCTHYSEVGRQQKSATADTFAQRILFNASLPIGTIVAGAQGFFS